MSSGSGFDSLLGAARCRPDHCTARFLASVAAVVPSCIRMPVLYRQPIKTATGVACTRNGRPALIINLTYQIVYWYQDALEPEYEAVPVLSIEGRTQFL